MRFRILIGNHAQNHRIYHAGEVVESIVDLSARWPGKFERVPDLIPVAARFTEGGWAGRRVFIVGGGPSAAGFPFDALRSELVVAVNKAHLCGVADVVFTGDRRWIVEEAPRENVPEELPIVFARTRPPNFVPYRSVYHMETCELWGFSFKDGVSKGGSGIRAANFASIMGASRIYLIGFDLRREEKVQVWWHGGYRRRDLGKYASLLAHWNKIIRARIIPTPIINLSPISRGRLKLPYQDWKEVLHGA